jgi:signal peptidase I
MDKQTDYRKILKKTWHFIWEDNSIWSWIVNVILAFVLIKFIVYPGLGFVLNTSHPVVAVVSRSMEHNFVSFDKWWDLNKDWYLQKGVTKEDFEKFPFKNGFNKGDIFILHGKRCEDLEIGEIVIFQSSRPDPIIHRVVKKWEDEDHCYLQTKGDNNIDSIKTPDLDETRIGDDQIIGKASFRVPYLGYIKIGFVCAIYGVQGKDNFIDCLLR